MLKAKVYNQKCDVAKEMDLPEKVFKVKANEALVHQAVVAQMANSRQVLAHTKVRSEVRGGGKKPWKQKGTGRARSGSSRSPIWIGGGVTFGPRSDRNFSVAINKKMKQKSLLIVLSDKLANNGMTIFENLDMDNFKTKIAEKLIKDFEAKIMENKGKKAKRSILLINDSKERKTRNSFRNLSGVEIINLENINIVDLLKYKNVFFTVSGIEKIIKQYSK